MTRFRRRRLESWEEFSARLIEETSAYLTECLRHPELTVRIPVIQAGTGAFPRSLSLAFWQPVLQDQRHVPDVGLVP